MKCWHKHRIVGDDYQSPCAVLDDSGRLHVGAIDPTGRLTHFSTAAGTWKCAWGSTVVTQTDELLTYPNTSIAVDAFGRVYVTYNWFETSPPQVVIGYAANEEGRWSVNPLAGDAYSHAIDVDSSGRVHVAFSQRDELYYVTIHGGHFEFESVDRSGSIGGTVGHAAVGSHVALALDPWDRPHISYYDRNRERLRYATKATGRWKRRTIDSNSHVGSCNSIAVDSSGRVHISYHRHFGDEFGELKYATNAPDGEWRRVTVDNGRVSEEGRQNSGLYSSLVIDSRGRPHISHYVGTSVSRNEGFLKYATQPGSSLQEWEHQVIDAETRRAGVHSSICVDDSDNLHVVYYYDKSGSDCGLKHATTAPSYWSLSTVDDRGGAGRFCAVSVDERQMFHACHFRERTNQLMFLTRQPGPEPLLEQIVDQGPGVGRYVSTAIDIDGRLHASYVDAERHRLKYAIRAESGEAWRLEEVDEAADAQTSIAVEPNGGRHISFCQYQPGNQWVLRYATKGRGSPTWQLETVEAGRVGDANSITVDATGRVHIGYQGWSNRDLHYATRGPSDAPWEISTMSSDVGPRSLSLAVDAGGGVHLAYMRNGRLMYALRRAGELEFVETAVDSTPHVGEYLSLGVDDWGRVHICYSDATRRSLKYASWVGSSRPMRLSFCCRGKAEDNSLAVDHLGRVHICFRDSMNQELRHVYMPYAGPYSFKSCVHSGCYIRHRHFLGEVTEIESDLDRRDATFQILPGLADGRGGFRSLESVNFPGYFLRHQDYRIHLGSLAEAPNEQSFREHATFKIVNGKGDFPQWLSFESLNFPDHFIQDKNGLLFLSKAEGILRVTADFEFCCPLAP